MNDFSTRFFAAIASIRASASCSGTGPGSASGAASRIAGGTIASISAARDANPSVASIARWSSGEGPMWRPMNAPRCSSVASGVRGAAWESSGMARSSCGMRRIVRRRVRGAVRGVGYSPITAR